MLPFFLTLLISLLAGIFPASGTDTSTYDALLPTGFTDAIGQHRDYHYNDAFLLDELQVIDPATSSPGVDSLSYVHDLTGRLTDIVPTAARLADAATPGDPTVSRSYDLLGRLETETSNGLSTAYGYDLLGQLSKVTTPGRTLAIQHDPAGRTSLVTDASTVTLQTSYGHDLAGRVVTEDMANGLQQTRAYDPIGRQLRQILKASNGSEISRTETQYDLLSNVTRLQEFYANPSLQDRLIENTYDERSQLVTETQTQGGTGQGGTGGSPVISIHRYDAAENLLTTTTGTLTRDFTYGDATNGFNSNQLYQLTETQGGTTTLTEFAYDDNGNRITKTKGGTGGSPVIDTYQYDSFNRLTELTLNGIPTRQYDYDPFTRRIAIRNPQSAIHNPHFAFSGSSPIEEWDGVRNNGSLLSHIGGGVGGRLYTEDSSGQTSTGIYNSRGDLTAELSPGGNLTWSGQYAANGLLQSQSGTKSGNYGANGKWEEPGNLVNDGFRYRDRSTGTFLTPDPAGFIDGPNRYNYVHHNPWSAFDPDGLSTVIPYTTGDIGYVAPSDLVPNGSSNFAVGDGSLSTPYVSNDVLDSALGENFDVFQKGIEYEAKVHDTDVFPWLVQYLDGMVSSATLGTEIGIENSKSPHERMVPSVPLLMAVGGMTPLQLDNLASSGTLSQQDSRVLRKLAQDGSESAHDWKVIGGAAEGAGWILAMLEPTPLGESIMLGSRATKAEGLLVRLEGATMKGAPNKTVQTLAAC